MKWVVKAQKIAFAVRLLPRHCCGVLVRRSRSFSKCRTGHCNRIKRATDQHNSGITLI